MLLYIFLVASWLLSASTHSIYAMDSQADTLDNQSSKASTAETPAPTFYTLTAYATLSDNEKSILTCDQSPFDSNKVQRFNTRLYLQGKKQLAQKIAESKRKKDEPRASITELGRLNASFGAANYWLTRNTPSHEVKSYVGYITLKNMATSKDCRIHIPKLGTLWDVADLNGKTIFAYTTDPEQHSIAFKDLTRSNKAEEQDLTISLPRVTDNPRVIAKVGTIHFEPSPKESASLAIIKHDFNGPFSIRDSIYLIDVTRNTERNLSAHLHEQPIAQTSDHRKQIRRIGWTRDGEKLMAVCASWPAAQPLVQLSKSVTAEIYSTKSGKLIAQEQLPAIAWNAPLEGKNGELSGDYSTIITCNLITKTSNDFVRSLTLHDVRQEWESRIPSKNIVHLLGQRQLTNNRVVHRKTAAQQAIQHK